MFTIAQSSFSVYDTKQKGRGVQTLCDIPPGTVIGDYLGTVIPNEDTDETAVFYTMYYTDDLGIQPDPKSQGIHLINHSCMPNCAMFPHADRMLYVSMRTIFPQEELSVSYMIEPHGEGVEHNYECLCHTPLCSGSCVVPNERADEFVVWIKDKRRGFGKMQYQNAGEVLLPLSSYPTTVADDPIHDIYGLWTKEPHIYNESTWPTTDHIRLLIRTTGRCVLVKHTGQVIVGVKNSSYIVSEDYSSYMKRVVAS
jgi:hypothetical protein